MTLASIYRGAGQIFARLLREELTIQGHRLTGALEQSISVKQQGNILAIFALSYAEQLDQGIKPEQISFKMIPGLINFFKLRGFDDIRAKRAAVNTIKVWMKEGMSTQASKRFSQSGKRQGFIDETQLKLDQYLSSAFDKAVDDQFNSTKSETI